MINYYMQKTAAEFIGTFALLFFGCGSIMLESAYPTTLPGGGFPGLV